jgi:hypothetical protein
MRDPVEPLQLPLDPGAEPITQFQVAGRRVPSSRPMPQVCCERVKWWPSRPPRRRGLRALHRCVLAAGQHERREADDLVVAIRAAVVRL